MQVRKLVIVAIDSNEEDRQERVAALLALALIRAHGESRQVVDFPADLRVHPDGNCEGAPAT